MEPTVVLVPVLGRPGRVGPLIANVAEATPEPYRLLFVASPTDRAERAALTAAAAETLIVGWRPGPGDYARKINAGILATGEPLCFLGADDLRFHPGWLSAAQAHLADGVDVVGTNDLYNPRVLAGEHATHSLVRRSYVERFGTIDEPGLALHPGYGHEFCDDEFIETARARGRFVHAADSVVEHLHPYAGKAPTDATYRTGWRYRNAGRALYLRRRPLWQP